MPQKQSQDRMKKQEIANKVNAIKQQQQNWLNQRAKALQTKPKSTDNTNGDQKVKARPCKSSEDVSRNHQGCSTRLTSSQMPDSSPSRSQTASSDSDTKDRNSRFQAWLDTQSRKNQVSDKTYHEGTLSDNVNAHCVGEDRPNSDKAVSSAHRLSPDEYDAWADTIANRVKRQLKIKDIPDTPSVNDSRKRTRDRSLPSGSTQQESGLESHYCPACTQFMGLVDNSPLLIIPCGHTLCQICAGNKVRCPCCGTSINSVTPNAMLQQIIIHYRNRSSPKLKHSPRQGATAAYSPANYQDGSRYVAEYQSLQLRCEVLESEIETIENTITDFDTEIQKEQNQIEGITKSEDIVKEEMRKVQRRLEQLNEHKNYYVRQVQDFENKKNDEVKRLILVKDTLRQIKQETDKVRVLAEGADTP